MQPPAQIQSALLSDRRIFKQGLFNNEKQSAAFCRGLFFAAKFVLHRALLNFCAPPKFSRTIKVFAPPTKVFARLFQKAARADGGVGRAPQSAKPLLGVFFFIAFSFAPVSSKEKADREYIFYFGC